MLAGGFVGTGLFWREKEEEEEEGREEGRRKREEEEGGRSKRVRRRWCRYLLHKTHDKLTYSRWFTYSR